MLQKRNHPAHTFSHQSVYRDALCRVTVLSVGFINTLEVSRETVLCSHLPSTFLFVRVIRYAGQSWFALDEVATLYMYLSPCKAILPKLW